MHTSGSCWESLEYYPLMLNNVYDTSPDAYIEHSILILPWAERKQLVMGTYNRHKQTDKTGGVNAHTGEEIHVYFLHNAVYLNS